MVSLAGRMIGMRKARTIRNSVLWPVHRFMGRVCESGFRDDLVVHLSGGTRKAYASLRRGYGLSESPIQVRIPNGIRRVATKACFDRAALVREFGAEAEKVQLCFGGRFTRQKQGNRIWSQKSTPAPDWNPVTCGRRMAAHFEHFS